MDLQPSEAATQTRVNSGQITEVQVASRFKAADVMEFR